MAKRGRTRRVLAAVLAVALAVAPALAADDAAETPTFDWNKAFDYTMCAVGIATAATGAGATLATLACGKLIIRYWE